MNRLTHERNNGIKTGYWSPNKKDELIEALAAYENTGLTPQDIYNLKAADYLRRLRIIPCKNCKFLTCEKSTGIYWCRRGDGLDGELTLNDGCSRGKERGQQNEEIN